MYYGRKERGRGKTVTSCRRADGRLVTRYRCGQFRAEASLYRRSRNEPDLAYHRFPLSLFLSFLKSFEIITTDSNIQF